MLNLVISFFCFDKLFEAYRYFNKASSMELTFSIFVLFETFISKIGSIGLISIRSYVQVETESSFYDSTSRPVQNSKGSQPSPSSWIFRIKISCEIYPLAIVHVLQLTYALVMATEFSTVIILWNFSVTQTNIDYLGKSS